MSDSWNEINGVAIDWDNIVDLNSLIYYVEAIRMAMRERMRSAVGVDGYYSAIFGADCALCNLRWFMLRVEEAVNFLFNKQYYGIEHSQYFRNNSILVNDANIKNNSFPFYYADMLSNLSEDRICFSKPNTTDTELPCTLIEKLENENIKKWLRQQYEIINQLRYGYSWIPYGGNHICTESLKAIRSGRGESWFDGGSKAYSDATAQWNASSWVETTNTNNRPYVYSSNVLINDHGHFSADITTICTTPKVINPCADLGVDVSGGQYFMDTDAVLGTIYNSNDGWTEHEWLKIRDVPSLPHDSPFAILAEYGIRAQQIGGRTCGNINNLLVSLDYDGFVFRDW